MNKKDIIFHFDLGGPSRPQDLQNFNYPFCISLSRDGGRSWEYFRGCVASLSRSIRFLDDDESWYQRAVIFYTCYNTGKTASLIEDILEKNYAIFELEALYESFGHYFIADFEDDNDVVNPFYKNEIMEYLPQSSWSLENGLTTPQNWEFFDEKIAVNLVWPSHEGDMKFTGYFYAASALFIEERLKTKEPYYRRHLLVSKYFHHKEIESLITEIKKKICTLHPLDRQAVLERYLEVDGQPNFYER